MFTHSFQGAPIAPVLKGVTSAEWVEYSEEFEVYRARYLGLCTTLAQRNAVLGMSKCLSRVAMDVIMGLQPEIFASLAVFSSPLMTDEIFRTHVEQHFLATNAHAFMASLAQIKMLHESTTGLQKYVKAFTGVARNHGNINGLPEPAPGTPYPAGQYKSKISVAPSKIVKQFVANMTRNLKTRMMARDPEKFPATVAAAYVEITNVEDDHHIHQDFNKQVEEHGVNHRYQSASSTQRRGMQDSVPQPWRNNNPYPMSRPFVPRNNQQPRNFNSHTFRRPPPNREPHTEYHAAENVHAEEMKNYVKEEEEQYDGDWIA